MPPDSPTVEVELPEPTRRGALLRALAWLDRHTNRAGRTVTASTLVALTGLATVPAADSPGRTLPTFLLVTGSVAGTLFGAHASLAAAGRRGQRRRRVVTGVNSRAILARAVVDADTVRAAWPRMGALVEGQPVDPLLAEELWALAGDLGERDRVDAARTEVIAAARKLPREEPLLDRLHQRRADLSEALARLDAAIRHRRTLLANLAGTCRAHLAEQEAIVRAGEAARNAERVLRETGLPARSGPDAGVEPGTGIEADRVAELTERTRAVLDAYRELRHAGGGVDGPAH
jgi:hypothetical protein